MSRRPLSKATNAKAEREAMRYPIQPREPGRSWEFRMAMAHGFFRLAALIHEEMVARGGRCSDRERDGVIT